MFKITQFLRSLKKINCKPQTTTCYQKAGIVAVSITSGLFLIYSTKQFLEKYEFCDKITNLNFSTRPLNYLILCTSLYPSIMSGVYTRALILDSMNTIRTAPSFCSLFIRANGYFYSLR